MTTYQKNWSMHSYSSVGESQKPYAKWKLDAKGCILQIPFTFHSGKGKTRTTDARLEVEKDDLLQSDTELSGVLEIFLILTVVTELYRAGIACETYNSLPTCTYLCMYVNYTLIKLDKFKNF